MKGASGRFDDAGRDAADVDAPAQHAAAGDPLDLDGATAVVTGGAGFIGSHLCEQLLASGARVRCLDSFLTGRPHNVAHLVDHPGFDLQAADVSAPIEVDGAVDVVVHLASAASPVHYLRHPIKTLKAGSLGTHHALGLAKAHGARFLLASTSEVYGDPLVHPQPETYWGNVNPIGPRSVYDEAKRFAEALTFAYAREHGLTVRVARIFNTYGPRMRADDGRVVPTFIRQALAGEPFTVHGDGYQTRSLCFVDDLVRGLVRLLTSDLSGPVNLGGTTEVTMLDLAAQVAAATGAVLRVEFAPRPADDPQVRCPDTTVARTELGWSPEVPLDEGIRRTVACFRDGSTGAADGGAPRQASAGHDAFASSST